MRGQQELGGRLARLLERVSLGGRLGRKILGASAGRQGGAKQ